MKIANNRPPIRVFVSDIQPILPAVAGGRLRLAGIWGNVPDGFEMNYVGTFDSLGQKKTIKKLGKNATEILVPCSHEHFSNLVYDNASFPDTTLFDLAFHRYAHLSEAYRNESLKYMQQANVVVFSHPWSYPLLKKHLNLRHQYLVYDSHNVESFLRAEMLLNMQYGQEGRKLLEEIVRIENDLINDAHLILACSKRDLEQFISLYGAEREKLMIAPNGVFLQQNRRKSFKSIQKKLKKQWRLMRPYSAVFSGSSYGPNNKALHYINQIAPYCPDIDFIITGDMNQAIAPQELSANVHLVGLLSQRKLQEVYQMVDVGINPMDAGSGSNIKVFTYMEAMLPVLSTPLGARGLDVLNNGLFNGQEAIALATLETFHQQLINLLENPVRRERISHQAYEMIRSYYNWKEISNTVCHTMKSKFQL